MCRAPAWAKTCPRLACLRIFARAGQQRQRNHEAGREWPALRDHDTARSSTEAETEGARHRPNPTHKTKPAGAFPENGFAPIAPRFSSFLNTWTMYLSQLQFAGGTASSCDRRKQTVTCVLKSDTSASASLLAASRRPRLKQDENLSPGHRSDSVVAVDFMEVVGQGGADKRACACGGGGGRGEGGAGQLRRTALWKWVERRGRCAGIANRWNSREPGRWRGGNSLHSCSPSSV